MQKKSLPIRVIGIALQFIAWIWFLIARLYIGLGKTEFILGMTIWAIGIIVSILDTVINKRPEVDPLPTTPPAAAPK